MADLSRLTAYLRERFPSSFELTWAELEALVDGPRPDRFREPNWWSNRVEPLAANQAQSRAWQSAGFRARVVRGKGVAFQPPPRPIARASDRA